MLIWSVDPVAFSIFGLDVRWYGLIYALAIVASSTVIKTIFKRLRAEGDQVPTKDQLDWFMLSAIFCVVGGARLGHVLFFELEYYIANPLEIPMLRNGGLSFHGGTIGLMIYVYIFCKRRRFQIKKMIDVLCIGSSLGVGIGRLANFFNQELYGKICSADCAVIFPLVDNFPRYPTQLFEALFEGFLNFWVLLIALARGKSRIIGSGRPCAIFATIYSSSRFIIEFYKETEVHTYFNCLTLTTGQVLSVALFLLGLVILHVNGNNNRSQER